MRFYQYNTLHSIIHTNFLSTKKCSVNKCRVWKFCKVRTSCRLERRKLYAVKWTWRRGNLGQYYAVIRSLATHGQSSHAVTVKTVFTPCCNLNSCLQDQKKVWRTSKIPTSILPQFLFIIYYTTCRGRIGKDW